MFEQFEMPVVNQKKATGNLALTLRFGCSEAPGTYNMYLGRDLSLWHVTFAS